MSFTATGPVFILLGLYVFLRKPQNLAFWLVFFAPFSATAIINFSGVGYKAGGVGLSVSILFLMFYCAAQFLYGRAFDRHQASRGHILQIALIGAFSLECLASLLINGAMTGMTAYQITQTIYLFAGIATTIMLSFEFTREGALEAAVTAARVSAVFVSAWGLFQLLCSITHIPYPDFIFNNSMSDFADMFDQNIDGLERIASVAVEPSVFATAMLHFCAFGVTALVCEKRLRTSKWYWSVGITLTTLIISTSTTAYVGIAVLALLLLLQRPRPMILFGTPVAAAAVLAITMVPKIQDAIIAATLEKSSTSSYLDRMEFTRQAVQTFLESPAFGAGWGAAPNYNALAALLGCVGIVGTILALAAGGATVIELGAGAKGLANGPEWKLAAYAAGARNAMIVSFCCAVTSGLKYVFLDDACFWAIAIALTTRLAIARKAAGEEQNLPLQPERRAVVQTRSVRIADSTAG